MAQITTDARPKIVIERPKLAGWVPLFTSLSVLILAFFILLNSYATFDEARTRKAIESIEMQFVGIFEKAARYFDMFEGTSEQTNISTGRPMTPGDDLIFEVLRNYYDSYETLQRYITDYGMGGQLGLLVTSRGLEITLGEDLVFAGGSSDLTPLAAGFLDRLVTIIEPFRNEILIEGHTDDELPASGSYLSNWNLSQARAIAVLRYLAARGIDMERLSAAGCGQFRPIAENLTPEARAMNRRVSIIIRHPRLR